MSKYQFELSNGDKVAIAKNRYAEAKGVLRGFIGAEKGGKNEIKIEEEDTLPV